MFRIYVNFKTAVSHKQPSRPVSPTSSRQELVSAEKSVYESQRGKRSSGDGGVSWFRGRSRRTERLRMTGSREHLVLHHVPCTEPSYGHSTPPGRAAALDEGSRQWWTAEQNTRHTHVSTHDSQTTINCTASYKLHCVQKKTPTYSFFHIPRNTYSHGAGCRIHWWRTFSTHHAQQPVPCPTPLAPRTARMCI